LSVRASKRFGQHFLTDPRKADRLVEALEISDGETVLEVGPGTGMLTERLLGSGADLIAVEIDRDLTAGLLKRFGADKRFKLLENDIIRIDPAAIAGDGLKVIGNLPYNISGAFTEWMIEYNGMLKTAVITVQKEVAERLRASPGGREYGSLSVMVQCFFDIRKLFDIPPGCFVPRPKVVSTALRFSPRRRLDSEIDYPGFRDFLRACFSRKRKKLANSLAASLNMDRGWIETKLVSLGLRRDSRAEQLSLSELTELFKSVGLA
jgi:16S rRNA (adenine1518-N6/adenine1519-N6)-dimethyltransferase